MLDSGDSLNVITGFRTIRVPRNWKIGFYIFTFLSGFNKAQLTVIDKLQLSNQNSLQEPPIKQNFKEHCESN